VTELDFRRIMPFAAAVAAAFSACTCSKSPASSSGPFSNGHVLDASGGASNGTGGTGGTGGGFATGATGGTSEVDAGPTGILPCASEPPSSVPVPSGWPAGAKRLPALDPDVYVFEVPPAGPLTWKACGTGCLELVNTWAPSLTYGVGAGPKAVVVNGTPWIMLPRFYQNRIDTWTGPVDGAAVRTLIQTDEAGTVPNGFFSPLGIAAAGYVLDVGIHDSTAWELGATLSGPLRCLFKEHFNRSQGTPQMFSDFATSDTRWALRSDGAPDIGELPLGSATAGIPELIASPPGYTWSIGLAGLPEGFVMTGYDATPQLGLQVWTPATGVVPFTAQPGPGESDSPPASDGRTVVWLHGSGLKVADAGFNAGVATWSNVELMEATDDGHFPVAGTVVGRLPTPYVWIKPLVYGDYVAGFVGPALSDNNPRARPSPFLLRLSDDVIWILPPRSPDVFWESMVYLSTDELALVESAYGGAWAHRTIVRYRLDSLGLGESLESAIDAGAP
jgi:hypothetical protein